MKISIPDLSLVVLVGASGSGKSSFARKHFKPTEIISSDACRGFVSDDENSQEATNPAFELVHFMIAKRLEFGRLAVVDATNVQSASRKALLKIANEYHVRPCAIVFNLPEGVCQERNRNRPDRNFGPHVIRHQTRDLRQSIRWLRKEGFKHVFVLDSEEEVNQVEITRHPNWTNRVEELGPFDIIGDVHGCIDEMRELLVKLGYSADGLTTPEGRRAIFVGDLVDRGPDSVGVVKQVKAMVEAGTALAVPGNHDVKLVRKLKGHDVSMNHGIVETLAQLSAETPETVEELSKFLEGLVSHFILDEGKLVVAHAGMKESMQGRASGAVRQFALYGETTGETDEFGLPVRLKWAEEYRGKPLVVFGHTPVVEPEWLNNTVCIDTGCVFGGELTALRYPENEIVSVPAKQVYCEPIRPLGTASTLTSQQASDDVLDISDVRGRQHIRCEGFGTIVLPEENASASLEVMSRFAADPKWVVYLPPTMSPSETSSLPDFLEHPRETFEYFANREVRQVVCEEKHMGSRTVVVVGKDKEAIAKRIGILDSQGIVYTRTGRPFFDNKALEIELISRLSNAMTAAGFWEEFATDWAVLDCELMPWSAKAQQLLRSQYAPVGLSASANLTASVSWLEKAADRLESEEINALKDQYSRRLECAEHYKAAYRHYCWPVASLDDYKLAPFHVLATEGAVHSDKTNVWHMEQCHAICEHDLVVLRKTPYLVLDPTSEEDIERGVQWWLELTSKGGEGMVVKPIDFLSRYENKLVQPALKCRGREYLRIIYGPEYLLPENLSRLKKRGLQRKRALATKEFGLGMEGLKRFVEKQPLRFVHQCAFGVLALESEPVDPRL